MPSATTPRQMLVILGVALAVSCSPRGSGVEPTATPLALSRCAKAPGILCIATFGMMPPDRMLVAVSTPVGGLSDLRLRVSYQGSVTAFPCTPSGDFPNSFDCTGPQIPLGSTIRIDVLTEGVDTVLASGEFFLAGFAVPTMELETPPPGTAYPNP